MRHARRPEDLGKSLFRARAKLSPNLHSVASAATAVAVTPIFAPMIRARAIVRLFLFKEGIPESFEENIDWVVAPRLPG